MRATIMLPTRTNSFEMSPSGDSLLLWLVDLPTQIHELQAVPQEEMPLTFNLSAKMSAVTKPGPLLRSCDTWLSLIS